MAYRMSHNFVSMSVIMANGYAEVAVCDGQGTDGMLTADLVAGLSELCTSNTSLSQLLTYYTILQDNSCHPKKEGHSMDDKSNIIGDVSPICGNLLLSFICDGHGEVANGHSRIETPTYVRDNLPRIFREKLAQQCGVTVTEVTTADSLLPPQAPTLNNSSPFLFTATLYHKDNNFFVSVEYKRCTPMSAFLQQRLKYFCEYHKLQYEIWSDPSGIEQASVSAPKGDTHEAAKRFRECLRQYLSQPKAELRPFCPTSAPVPQ